MNKNFKIYFCLGNFSEKYENTYHNAGFIFGEKLADFQNTNFQKSKTLNCMIAEFFDEKSNEKKMIIKPMGFMNNSGIFAKKVSDFFKVESENFLFITDSIDNVFGEISLKKNFTRKSHNGLNSIYNQMNLKKLNVLRIGILPEIFLEKYQGKFDDLGVGRLSDFVLKKISKKQLEILNKNIEDFLFSFSFSYSQSSVDF